MKYFLDEDGFVHRKKPKLTNLTVLERVETEPDYFTDVELCASRGSVFVFDIEVYPNYFLIAFKCYNTGKVVTFELFPGKPVFDYQKLLWTIHSHCLVGFNSNKFDIPILYLALSGASLDQINEAVEGIIKYNWMPRDVENRYGFKIGSINTVDLIEVAPLSASLKTYGGRLHAIRLQDLPFDPNKALNEKEARSTMLYCVNDLDLTALLLKELEPQLELRASMSLEYKVDLRSKSDAQVAETVITNEVRDLKGFWSKKPTVEPGTVFKYRIPHFVQYQTPILQEMLEVVRNADFVVANNGSILEPPEFQKLKELKVGHSAYRMGIGGLHSNEESVSYKSDENHVLIDRDVASYYPNIILNQELYPKHLGEQFLDVYRGIVKRRLKAKKEKNKVVADSLKICVNGSFGKLASKYSNLYAPELLIQVTVSGQLCLLMLIEMLELSGITVVSGNTDGIVILCEKSKYATLLQIIEYWETLTGFETEETPYKAVYSRDVNNYIAVKEDDSVKLKGAYAKPGLSKNPVSLICVEAVTSLIVGNIPIEQTIKECTDITKFVTVRNVKGGGEQDGVYLGKVVRWYYAHKHTSTINYVLSGNKVPKSEGAKPILDLPPSFPTDIDYNRYIDEATEILYEIGYLKKPTQPMFFEV